MTVGLQLGAPGVYYAPRQTEPRFQSVRLDVAGFVGVALRGPVDTPVAVGRWSEYELLFGAFERGAGGGERLLPYAVQAFFAQGGAKAFIVRVAAASAPGVPTAEEATARYRLDLASAVPMELAAADEGTWGNNLSIRLDFDVAQTFRASIDKSTDVVLPAGVELAAMSLLRIRRPGLGGAGQFRWILEVAQRLTPAGGARRAGILDAPFPGDSQELEFDVITGTLVVAETGSTVRRDEKLTGLGLRPGHPRFLATVVSSESLLVQAAGDWPTPVTPDRLLRSVPLNLVHRGSDRSGAIDYRSYYDDAAPGDDPLDELPHRGVDAMGRNSEIGLLAVPDLQWRTQPAAPEPPPPSPSAWTGCGTTDQRPVTYSDARPVPVPLDGRVPEELDEIINRQLRLVQVADLRRRFVALLDVPAGLPVHQIVRWRARFDSSFAAGYHPWLGLVRADDPQRRSISVPPSGFAAGIIAARERRFGLPWGPANELAAGAVQIGDAVTDAIHDQLHVLGINVYRAERDGFRLTAARTLSSDPEYRQLSVRRLMTMLALTLDRQSQWLVFEPNTPSLRQRLNHSVTQFLRELHRRGAFAGETESQSFFVRCDDGLNPPSSQALGRLIAEVGVAPSSPLEYLVLRISQDVDGSVSVVTEESPGAVALGRPLPGTGRPEAEVNDG